MGAEISMNEKLRTRMQTGAAPLMEPDETVIYGVSSMTMPAWAYVATAGLLALPYVVTHAQMAVMTEHNVYVFKNSGVSLKASRVLVKAPNGSTDAHVGGSGFPGRYLQIADQKIWLPFNSGILRRANAIAEAASGGAATGVGPSDDTAAAPAGSGDSGQRSA